MKKSNDKVESAYVSLSDKDVISTRLQEELNEYVCYFERNMANIIRMHFTNEKQLQSAASIITYELWNEIEWRVSALQNILNTENNLKNIQNKVRDNLIDFTKSLQGKLLTIVEAFIQTEYQKAVKDLIRGWIYREYHYTEKCLVEILMGLPFSTSKGK